jgi:hypothetical protein
MANTFSIDTDKEKFIGNLQKGVQSANLNFIIGSGCSKPAIGTLGTTEKEIQSLLEEDKIEDAEKKTFEFLKPFVDSTSQIVGDTELDKEHQSTFDNYKSFIDTIAKLLFERKSNILHKQATIFTTNYDLFIEKVSENLTSQIIINDGFQRNSSLKQNFSFSASNFFNVLYSTGNLYNYQVEIPAINLIKLHGSLNWEIKDEKIINSFDFLKKAEELKEETDMGKIVEFNNLFSLILPKKDKFKETLLNQVYYDMLRVYANELDKENTLLIADGFSFDDEHILEITKRALKNPTLKLVIFCWSKRPRKYEKKFSEFNNVEIVYSETHNIDFEKFNEILIDVLPKEKIQIQKVEIVKTEQNEE